MTDSHTVRSYLLLFTISTGLLLACGSPAESDEKSVVKADTVYSGLEGTRDQPGQLTTDARPDTSGGQAQTETITSADSSGRSKASSAGASFVTEQVESNYDEIGVAKLASKGSSDRELISIGESLVQDHSKALDMLRKMADSMKLTVASDPSAGGLQTIASLNKKKGKDFDKAWCETLIDQHKTAISKYEAASKTLSEPGPRAFAIQTLPKLRMHLDKLMAYHGQIKS